MKPSTGDFVWKVWPYRKCSTRSMRRRFAVVFFERCCPTFSCFPAIGHFWVTKTLTFKTRLSSKPFLCIWILFAWEYHRKSSYKKSFKFIMPMVEDAEYACIPHKWIVLFARADWLARWLAKYYSWLSSDVTKIHTPKSQGLVRFYHHLAKYLLKIHFRARFRRDIVFHFENIALSNFASLLRVTLIWRPRRPSNTLKNNFIAWYYALWMVKVLENVFRGIICSFAVNNWSNLWRYWNQMFALFPAAIFVLVSPLNFCYTFWRKTQQWKTAQTWDLARLLIHRYSIIFEILGFRHSKVLILVFDGLIVKTMHQFTSQPSRSGNKKDL